MSDENKVYVETPTYLKVDRYNKVIQKASDLATWLKYSPAAASQSAINFVFTAPSTSALLYEKILMSLNSVALDLEITNDAVANQDAVLFPNNSFSLRDFPLHRLFQSVALTIGSSTLSIPLNDILDVYRYCAFDHDEMFSMGSFTQIKDEVAGTYALNDSYTGVNPNANAGVNNTGFTALGSWASQQTTQPNKRGMASIENVQVKVGNNYVNLTSANNKLPVNVNDKVNLRITFSVVEPLLLPIFEFLKKEAMSLTHISQFQLSFILANPSSIISYALPLKNSLSVAWAASNEGLSQNNVNLFLKWITAPAGLDYSDICRPMYDLQRYISQYSQGETTKTLNVYAQGPKYQMNSQTISLPVVPSKLVFAMKYPRSIRYGGSTAWCRTADTFLPITNIKITFGNRSNLLSSADIQCLYLESVESGLKGVNFQTFKGWAPKQGFVYNKDATFTTAVGNAADTNYIGLSGAPLVIDVAKTLGLPSDLAVGVSAPVSLQVIVDFIQPFDYVDNNGNREAIKPELYIIAANQSYFEIARNGASRITQGGVSPAEVAMVNSMGTESVDNEQVKTFVGGDFFGSIKEGLKNLAPIARKVINVADQGLKMAGYGMTAGGRKGMKAISM